MAKVRAKPYPPVLLELMASRDFLRGGGQVRTVATVNSRPCPAAQLTSLQAVAAGDTRSLAWQSVRAVHHARGRL
jgi:hypothetical protein